MTEQTGTAKSYNVVTKLICENIGSPAADGSVIVSLKPNWDDKITEHQLATRGESGFVIALRVPADSKSFFEMGSPVFLGLTKTYREL